MYHYAGNNPVKYTDPDGNDIKESELYSFSIGVGVAARISFGIAKDSNHNVSVYIKLETGIGAGGSIAKADTIMKALDTGITILTDIINDYNAIGTLDNVVLDTGQGNFDGNITYKKETVFDWNKAGKSVPVEAAVIVGASADENGKYTLTIGATAIANVYLREDTASNRLKSFLGGKTGTNTDYRGTIGTVFEGCQFVYDSKGNLVTDSLNQGTFDTKSPNSFIGKLKHFASDVIPWLKWGNGTANNQVMPPGLQASIENVLNDFKDGNITKDTAKNEIENIVRSFKESQND